MKTITLSASDLKLVQDFMSITGTQTVTIRRDDSSGIGYTLDVCVDKTLDKFDGSFCVRLVDEKDW